MAEVHLLFAGPPIGQPANLVFGASDAGGVVPDATLAGGDLALPSVAFTSKLSIGEGVAGGEFGTLPMPAFVSELVYFTNTQRPVVSKHRDYAQVGQPLETGAQTRMQQASHLPTPHHDHAQEAAPLQVSSAGRFQQGVHAPNDQRARFQDGIDLRAGAVTRMQDGIRVRTGGKVTFQEGIGLGMLTGIRFQDGLKSARNWAAVRFQDGLAHFVQVVENEGYGKPIRVGKTSRFQKAIKPPPGVSTDHIVVPPEDPCYIPSGDLVFSAPWSADTNLVFVCDRHSTPPVDPGTGETVVVPVKRVYVVLNEVSLRRVEGNIPLPTISMSMSLDVDSWTWSFSASLPTFAKTYVEPNTAGDPVEVEANINGVPYRLLVESMARDRSFGQDRLNISGRGLSATLDAPYAPILNFGNTGDRTAQQLMGDVLTLNGVSLGWDVDWQIEDWTVPGGVWTQQGSYIDGLKSIVQAAGGYLQPVPSGKSMRALLRYPTAPWAWGDVTPDYELPAALAVREGIEWQEKARYNRVFVSGVGAGVNGQVTRAGTDGGLVAPQVTDSLILSAIPARQRGISVLADTGRIANVSLRLPVLAETGVIPPGKFIRYTDNGVPRIGITRSVSLDVGLPEVFQTISLECHE